MVMALTAWFFGSPSTGQATPIYWNLFNFEEENVSPAVYVTYATLNDMLIDTNRTGTFIPDTFGLSAHNVVGSGAFVENGTPPVSVPEPSTLGLFGLGLACLVVTVRRRCTGAQSLVPVTLPRQRNATA
jgi:hypothetical protein